MKFCPNCGAQLLDNARFCTSCGHKQEIQTTDVPIQPPVYYAPVESAPVYEAPMQPPVYSAPVEPVSVYEAPIQPPVYSAPVEPAPVYETPVQQPVYAAPAYEVPEQQPVYNYGAPQMPPVDAQTATQVKTKKSGGKKVLLFAGIALALVAVAVLLVTLLGGGAEIDDANLGVYEAVSCIVDGEEADCDEYWIELKAKGKAVLCMDGEESNAKWSLDGRDFVLTVDGEEYEGKLKKGALTITIDDTELVFEKADAEDEAEDESDDDETETADTETEEVEAEPLPEVGYWTMIRTESDDPQFVLTEDVVTAMRDAGMLAYIELREDGTGVLVMISEDGEEPLEFTWVPGELTADDGSTVNYVIEGDMFYLTIDDMVVVFTRGEIAPSVEAPSEVPAEPSVEAPVEEPQVPEIPAVETNPYDWWAGDWYGWWVVLNGEGVYADSDGDYWDTYAYIEVDGDSGFVTVWDEDCAADESIANVDVSFVPGAGECGAMISQSGWFYDDDVAQGEWYADPTAAATHIYDRMITIEGVYIDPDDASNVIEYAIILRPWGVSWEDVRNGDNSTLYYDDMMPRYYDDWYMPLVRMGEGLPESYEEGLAIIEAGPAVSLANGALATGIIDSCTVSIMGAETFKDNEGKDGIRVYYDFTNNTNETLYAQSVIDFDFTQDGNELDYTYASYDNYVPEDGNDFLNVRPGATVRCIAEYNVNMNGGAVSVVMHSYWGGNGEVSIQLQPNALPGKPTVDPVKITVPDPQWMAGWPREGDCGTAHVRIDRAEVVEGVYGEEVLRVYFVYTNNGTAASSLWMDTYPCVYQDGIELWSVTPDQEVTEDGLFYEDVEPGQTVTVSQCYAIYTDSNIEVEVTDGVGGGNIGAIYSLEQAQFLG